MELDPSNYIEPDEADENPYIFISYARRDMENVQNVLRLLRKNRFRFWYDKGLKSGSEWAEELGQNIEHCVQFLVLISQNAVNSKYVSKEISMAVSTDKNILVVYIDETKLTSGLRLLIGNIQALHMQAYTQESAFEKDLCQAADHNTLYAPETSFSTEPLEGTYEILQPIGAGGSSTVYLARQKRTDTLAAVKCCPVHDSFGGKFAAACLNNEKEILRILTQNLSPYVPHLIDWYEDEKQLFLVESFIGGKTLNHYFDTLPTEEEVIKIAENVLMILQHLHRNNILYLDIKPHNLCMTESGDVCLLDFGISRALNEHPDPNMFGLLLGTPGYASPEQYIHPIESGNIDFSADIYSLGRTMQYLLYPDGFDRMSPPAPIRYYRNDISPELEAVLEKMTAADPHARYRTAEEVQAALHSLRQVSPFRKIKNRIRSGKISKIYKKQETDRRKTRMKNIQAIADDATTAIDTCDTVIMD